MKKLIIGAPLIFAALFLWYLSYRLGHTDPPDGLTTVLSIYTAVFIGFLVYYFVRWGKR
jgi:NhaP-type Na+/H+ or K+/H+ antiporter